MARSLVAWAFQETDIKVVTASCLDDNIGSIKVLENVGMRRLEPDGNMLKWEIRKDNWATARIAPTFFQWIYIKCRPLPFNPASTSIGGVAQGQVCCVHKALTSRIEADTLAHPVHGISKGHVSNRVSKANCSTKSRMSESLF